MFALVKQKNGDLDIYESYPDIQEVVHFLEMVHTQKVDSSSDPTKEACNSFFRYCTKDSRQATTLAHIRDQIIAVSDNKESLVGAAAMSMLG